MSLAARSTLRAVARSTPRVRPQARIRGFASAVPAESVEVKLSEAALQKFLEADKPLVHHAAHASDLWRKISFYVCVPAIAVCVAWVYNVETEHIAHVEHLKVENGGELPPTPAFDYMNRRTKPFPWGMNSLFYNPHVNKNMEEEA